MDKLKTEKILGFDVVTQPISECLLYINKWLPNNHRSCFMACLNPHSLMVSKKDEMFRKALLSADLLLPDGIGIVAASKLFGGTIQKRITGSDLFQAVNLQMNKISGSVFFLGSTEDNLAAIRVKMAEVYPHIRIAGTYSPPFKDRFTARDNRAMIEAVNSDKPDVLWVAMTAPKQEKWIYQNIDDLDVGLIGAVGAVFDFFIDNVKRAHPTFQKWGLEWLPRLLRQPKRLWKRNLISSPLFLQHLLRNYIQSRK